MQRLTQRILETSMVDERTRELLERWGLFGAAQISQRKDLLGSLEEIERLLGREGGAFRQSMLDVDWDSPGVVAFCCCPRRGISEMYDGVWDLSGHLILRRNGSGSPDVGHIVWENESTKRYEIIAKVALYEEDRLAAWLLTVNPVRESIDWRE